MTMAGLRRKYPSLLRQVERTAHSKFKRKPTLVFAKGGRPRETVGHIYIPKRMARENEKLATLAVLHEAREALARESGQSDSKAHRIARRAEKGNRKKLGLKKSSGWLFREHYGWGKKARPERLTSPLVRLICGGQK